MVYSIVAMSTKKDIVKKYLEYTMSAKGVKTAQMLGYRDLLLPMPDANSANEVDPVLEAQRSGQVNGVENDPIRLINDGRIHYRGLPAQRALKTGTIFGRV